MVGTVSRSSNYKLLNVFQRKPLSSSQTYRCCNFFNGLTAESGVDSYRICMMLIQAEEDECLVRCLATPGEQEANIGAAGGWYKHYICLSVGFSSVLIVLLNGLPSHPVSGSTDVALFYGLDSLRRSSGSLPNGSWHYDRLCCCELRLLGFCLDP